MIYDSKVELDVAMATQRFKWLIKSGKRFELTEKKAKRSLSQNSYLHLLFGWFGLQFGYTREETKQRIFKEVVNPEIFYEGDKDGIVKIERWRSTADLKTDEMALAIDRFRNFSAEHGVYLPEPKDLVIIQQIENELSKNASKEHL
ncbi:hypothetical protein C7967_11510 [Thalassospira sp. 11-3]|nr:hypothetical protein C7967_11510 [Thalassospira sp. 11-3]